MSLFFNPIHSNNQLNRGKEGSQSPTAGSGSVAMKRPKEYYKEFADNMERVNRRNQQSEKDEDWWRKRREERERRLDDNQRRIEEYMKKFH